MHCLDTNIVIDHFRGSESITGKIQQLKNEGFEIAITTITLCELCKGFYLSEQKEANLAVLNGFLNTVTLLSQSRLSCILFGKDFALLKTKGLMTQEMALMIASICKANNSILITRNIKDFKNIPDLAVNSW
ncbi:type II toxin-antitoxin system VapC family toxin [Candidatus Woesearchaeota archaeon]|nr:type II toxin-antitoxin system VapC family toxin [Candidatus Woesearchaeota archaeon]